MIMPKDIHLSKVSIRRVMGETEYATDDVLMESLSTMRALLDVPIGKYVRDLVNGVVDTISFTKDEPYYYFFARRFQDSLSVSIKDVERIIEFSVPLRDAEKMLIA